MDWNVIVVTCSSLSRAEVLQRELDLLKQKERIPKNVPCIAVEDPFDGVGSGGATLNALLIAAEYLSSQQGFSTVTADIFDKAHILILHHGRDYLYEPGGRGFIPGPVAPWHDSTVDKRIGSGILTNLEYLVGFCSKLQSSPGVWVCSTDMVLEGDLMPLRVVDANCDACMVCVPGDVEYATNHGVMKLDPDEFMENILYCSSKDTIAPLADGGKVQVVAGIVYFSVKVAEALLSMHTSSPIDSCTYMGVDAGARPLQVSLFFDILIAMATGISKDQFCSGYCGKTYNVKYGLEDKKLSDKKYAREIVWKHLNKFRMRSLLLSSIHFTYLSDDVPLRETLLPVLTKLPSGHHTLSKPLTTCINTLIKCPLEISGSGHIICNSKLFGSGRVKLGDNAFLSGVICDVTQVKTFNISSNIAVVGFPVLEPDKHTGQLGNYCGTCLINVMFGISDRLKRPYTSSDSTIFNIPWSSYFDKTGITAMDIWEENLQDDKCLYNAKLFPVTNEVTDVRNLLWLQECDKSRYEVWRTGRRISLQEIMGILDYGAVFECRRMVYQDVTLHSVSERGTPPDGTVFKPYFKCAFGENWAVPLLDALDSTAGKFPSGDAARLLACAADLMGCMAETQGNLRSGPASNPAWARAFYLLENVSLVEGVVALKTERQNWLARRDRLVRAARHYEKAAHILIRQTVMSARSQIRTKVIKENIPAIGKWVTARCPARVDLQGGWSDTPPICYEQGGSVVNVAILVDGEKPIGCRARRINEPVAILKLGDGEYQMQVRIEKLEDVKDYCNPMALGALLKTALLCAGILSLDGLPLEEQLLEHYGSGIELESWSRLPQGSGLGTSSILAGAVIAALWTLAGVTYDKRSLIHAVLCLEQMLTTGGGWQDQVGGIMGGVNRGYSFASQQVAVDMEHIPLNSRFLDALNSRLVLLYTGKVRLARNLLQNVLRNWYARDEEIVKCFQDLMTNASQGTEALRNEDLQMLGHCMNVYWQQKKLIAPGCEPVIVSEMMKKFTPYVYGQVLAGAGGGGFMLLLTKESNMTETLKSVLHNVKDSSKVSFYAVKIDTTGLSVDVDGSSLEIPYSC